MYQEIETTDQEKFEMYNLLEKEVLIGMLIESNKHLRRLTPTIVYPTDKCFYIAGDDTSGKCINCRKQKWEH